jgi:hypothetical protein
MYFLLPKDIVDRKRGGRFVLTIRPFRSFSPHLYSQQESTRAASEKSAQVAQP